MTIQEFLNLFDGGAKGKPPNDEDLGERVRRSLREHLARLGVNHEFINRLIFANHLKPIDRNLQLRNLRRHATLFQRHVADFVSASASNANDAANRLTALYEERRRIEEELTKTPRYVAAPNAERPKMSKKRKLAITMLLILSILFVIPASYVFSVTLLTVAGGIGKYRFIAMLSGGLISIGTVWAYLNIGRRIGRSYPGRGDNLYWFVVEVMGILSLLALILTASSITGGIKGRGINTDFSHAAPVESWKKNFPKWALPVEALAELGLAASMIAHARSMEKSHRRTESRIEDVHWIALTAAQEKVNAKISFLEGIIESHRILLRIMPREQAAYLELADVALGVRHREHLQDNGINN